MLIAIITAITLERVQARTREPVLSPYHPEGNIFSPKRQALAGFRRQPDQAGLSPRTSSRS